MAWAKRYWSLLLLAVAVGAAVVCRRFIYVAWYPVVMSAVTAGSFALSLLGKESLCYTLAKKIPPHILPPDAEAYCRKYTAFWAVWLTVNGLIAIGTIYVPVAWVAWNCVLSYCVTGLIILTERIIRRRRFAVVFHTSGSTATPKRIVKEFATLAKETAYHLAALRADGILGGNASQVLFLATIEPTHLYGMLWRVLLPKAALCAVDGEIILTPEALLAKMRTAEKVFLVTTPSFLERFCAFAEQYEVPRNCVEIVTSGALLTAKTSAAAREVFGVAPREIFGSTETGGVAWRRQGQENPNCDWQVFAPVKTAVTDDGRLMVDSPFAFVRWFAMGDGVELAADGRTFKLFARRDRLVKIAEQRVSLPEMEAAIAQLPEVREAALAKLEGRRGDYLGAVVVLSPSADVSAGKRQLALNLRQRLLPMFPKGTAPKRYRFVYELPRNAQGKVQTARIAEILESSFVEPFVSRVEQNEREWSADMVFDASAPYFEGHFPSFAVLPGVVQLGTAHHFAEVFLRRKLRLNGVKKMKFVRPVVPNMKVRLSLTVKNAAEIVYIYEYQTANGNGGEKEREVCASGVLWV